MSRQIHSYQEYVALVEEMIGHDKRYFVEAKPIISDFEYDQNLRAMIDYEKEHPDEIHPSSPSRRLAEAALDGFIQKEHLVPMYSLANTYSEGEIEDFLKRVEKILGKKEIPVCCELKMDGVAISLLYEKGRLVHALTRGNGRMGDDVTANIKTIRSVPLVLEGKNIPEKLEVRGEVYMNLSTFQELNEEKEEAGEDPFANPRNAAAGSLKLLDPKEVAKRKLNLITYAIADGLSPVAKQHEVHSYLKSLGFQTATAEHLAIAHDLSEILKFAQKIQEARKALPFEIDGVVIKVDEIKLHQVLGHTGKTPRFAVAYKFAPEQASTVVHAISVQVGRTGVLTPVAELEPVFLSGSTISRATLHNQEEVSRKDIRIGDTVIIEKGGDVIPKVVTVDLSKRPKDSHPWHIPNHCPICKTKTVVQEGEVAIRCPNSKCQGQRIRRIVNFASKHALDIEHLGDKVIHQLVERGLISRISDLYLLDEPKLSKLDHFKEKSIANLLHSIDASRDCPLSRLIMGLGIPHVGTETAELLAEHATNLKHLLQVTEEELLQIDGIGEKTAKIIANFFQDPDNQEEIELLLAHGMKPQKALSRKIAGHLFSGKTFVLTGALSHYSRDQATALIKERGGKVSSSVSKKTDYVLVGEEPGSKYEKAKDLNVKILSESEFKDLI